MDQNQDHAYQQNIQTQPKKEFYPLKRTRKNFKNFFGDVGVTQIRDIHFLKSEWENFQKVPLVSWSYIFYRGVFMVLFLFIFFYTYRCSYLKEFFFIFLTHWSLVLQVAYSVLFFIRVILGAFGKWKARPLPSGEYDASVEQQQDESRASQNSTAKGIVILQATIWILQPICCVMSIVVTLGFWLTVYDPEYFFGNTKGVTPCEFPSTCMIHGVNVFLAFADMAIISLPVHVTHFVYVVIYGVLYCTFSGLYEVINGNYPVYRDEKEHGEYIYKILDWRAKPGIAALATLIAMITALILFMLIYFLYALRLYVVSFLNPLIYYEHIYKLKGDPCVCNHPHIHGHGFTCEQCRLRVCPELRPNTPSLVSVISLRERSNDTSQKKKTKRQDNQDSPHRGQIVDTAEYSGKSGMDRMESPSMEVREIPNVGSGSSVINK